MSFFHEKTKNWSWDRATNLSLYIYIYIYIYLSVLTYFWKKSIVLKNIKNSFNLNIRFDKKKLVGDSEKLNLRREVDTNKIKLKNGRYAIIPW